MASGVKILMTKKKRPPTQTRPPPQKPESWQFAKKKTNKQTNKQASKQTNKQANKPCDVLHVRFGKKQRTCCGLKWLKHSGIMKSAVWLPPLSGWLSFTMSLYARRKACSDVSLVDLAEIHQVVMRDDSRLVCSTTLGRGILFNVEKHKNNTIWFRYI